MNSDSNGDGHDFEPEFLTRLPAATEKIDPYCLDELVSKFRDEPKLEYQEVAWLLTECAKLHRTNRVLDIVQERHDEELREKDRELQAFGMEMADALDRIRQLEQTNDVLQMVADHARAKLDAAKAEACQPEYHSAP